MYRNIPAIPANIHKLDCPMFPIASPTAIPTKDKTEDTQLHRIACRMVIPFFSRTAKSPFDLREEKLRIINEIFFEFSLKAFFNTRLFDKLSPSNLVVTNPSIIFFFWGGG